MSRIRTSGSATSSRISSSWAPASASASRSEALIPVLVKICGVTRSEDARLCADLNVDFIGINIWPRSPRSVSPERAAELSGELRGIGYAGKIVLVTVSPSPESLAPILKQVRPDFVQVHGEWSGEKAIASVPVLRAFSLGSREDLDPIASWADQPILIDARVEGMMGGTGRTVPEELLRGVARPYLLAGGLKPGNVAAIIRRVQPWGVDVASGVEEAPGKKDHGAVKTFVREVRTSS